MNFQGKDLALKMVGKSTLLVKKYSPELLLGTGLVGMVTSAVMACKATLKVDAVMKQAETDISRVKEGYEKASKSENPSVYTEQDYKRDLAIVHIQKTMKVGRLYTPAILVGGISVASILAAHGIMSKRQASLALAYALMEQSYEKYRENVKEELGPEKDYEFATTRYESQITDIHLAGEEPKVEVVRKKTFKEPPYSFWFKPTNRWYQRNDFNNNIHFLTCQQSYANDRLRAYGHVFLNDVLVSLGMTPTSEGQLIGWLDEGDSPHVDFMLDNRNPTFEAFRSGESDEFLVILNVQPGTLYDRI